MSTLWAVRHAPVDAAGLCYGRSEVATRISADAAAARVLALGTWPIAQVWSSPSARCRGPAEQLAAALAAPLTIDERLYELCDQYGVLVLAGWCCCDRWEMQDEWGGDNRAVALGSLRDQARRISACSIKFFWTTADAQGRAQDGFERGAIVRSGLFFREDDASLKAREDAVAQRRAERAAAPRFPGRPTKKERRKLSDFLNEP